MPGFVSNTKDPAVLTVERFMRLSFGGLLWVYGVGVQIFVV